MSTARPPASVVVRTFNSAATLTACLESLCDQTVVPEIVIVDSGSTDATLATAERLADRILRIPHASFSYGGALNRGAEVAGAEVHFALSSHCVVAQRDWIERSLRHYERPEIAATNGQVKRPDGLPLLEPLLLTADTPLPDPFWGFSNHASSWRADVWRREPFDETLIASEDFEWAGRVLASGHAIVFDPALTVLGHHLRAQGPLAFYRRSRREFLGASACRPLDPPTLGAALVEWWSRHPPQTKPYRQRLSPYRVAMIAGRYAAGRTMRRQARRGEPVGRFSPRPDDGRS
jgi:rhamnosyltransferase